MLVNWKKKNLDAIMVLVNLSYLQMSLFSSNFKTISVQRTDLTIYIIKWLTCTLTV